MQSIVVDKSEIQLQAECFQWAWNTYPVTRLMLFAVPNGGKRSLIEAVQFKASGVVAGVPDLLFLWGSKVHAFELKTPTGVLSKAQKRLHPIWEANGIKIHIVRSFEHFKELFNLLLSNFVL